MRAVRLGGAQANDNLLILTATDLDAILLQANALKPQLLIIDSIQTMYNPELQTRASQQHKAAGHDATTKHAVKFANPGRQAFYLGLGNAGDSTRPQLFVISRQIAFAGLGRHLGLLYQRVPATAFRAASQPRRSNITTFLADKSALSSGHQAAPFRC